jgi:hypothetical protein
VGQFGVVLQSSPFSPSHMYSPHGNLVSPMGILPSNVPLSAGSATMNVMAMTMSGPPSAVERGGPGGAAGGAEGTPRMMSVFYPGMAQPMWVAMGQNGAQGQGSTAAAAAAAAGAAGAQEGEAAAASNAGSFVDAMFNIPSTPNGQATSPFFKDPFPMNQPSPRAGEKSFF